MKCARCKEPTQLVNKSYEGTSIDQCPKCHGIWLDEGELVGIVRTQEESIESSVIQETLATAFKGIPELEKSSHESCPKCSTAMSPLNYAYSSGIIIDRCTQGHGVWLDGKELEKIQAHSEHHDRELEANRADWVALVNAERRSHAEATNELNRRNMRPTKYVVNSLIKKLLNF